MLQSLCGGLGSVGLAALLADSPARGAALMHYNGPRLPVKAKRVISLFMPGGPSHVDMFDPKPGMVKYAGQRPNAVDLRTERQTGGLLPSSFAFQKHGQSGVEVSELLPQIGSVIDEICVIRSMYSFNPTHMPARSLFHSGSILATRPSTGSWISYGLGTENDNLPAFVVLSPDRGAPMHSGRISSWKAASSPWKRRIACSSKRWMFSIFARSRKPSGPSTGARPSP